MVVMPRAGVQDLVGVFKHSCTEPLMKTMSPSPAFLFAGQRSLSTSSNLFIQFIANWLQLASFVVGLTFIIKAISGSLFCQVSQAT